jgi:NAD(P)-dependent dehydrogenase (short-subunit alcohol dehydrogenase family)
MARIFITGSADGLGRAAATTLLGGGHEVIVHARSTERLAAVKDLLSRGASGVVGDLADLNQTRAVADQVNQLGRVDAVIHNAGILSGRAVLPVNVVAPYLTQEWLATSDQPEPRSSGGYWFHQRRHNLHPAVRDKQFQDSLLASLARFTAAPLN